MAAKHHRHIALTEPLARFVEWQVAGRLCALASKVAGADLRLRIERGKARARPVEEEGRSHG